MSDGSTRKVDDSAALSGRQATVASNHGSWTIDDRHSLVFGRAPHDGVVGLDATDTGLSRVGGRIALADTGIIVENLSKRRPVFVEYPKVVRQSRIEPGAAHVLVGDALVLVPGKNFTHSFAVRVSDLLSRRTGPVDTSLLGLERTELDGLLAATDRDLLTALAAGYLARWPRHDPNPVSYSEAAGALGIAETTARKRLENLRVRLTEAEVLHTEGTNAMRTVVEWAIDTGVVRIASTQP